MSPPDGGPTFSHSLIDQEWHNDNPPRFGYYLAAWFPTQEGRCVVSELWFNDCAAKTWWSDRGYLGERSPHPSCHTPINTVVSWRNLPPPPLDAQSMLASRGAGEEGK